MRSVFFVMSFFLAVYMLPFAVAQDPITIVFPEDGVTYGPWSDTYYFSEQYQTSMHHIRMKVAVDQENVEFYRIYRNGEPFRYVGNQRLNDAMPGDEVVDFEAADSEPLDFVGNLYTMNNFTVVAYNEQKKPVGSDSVVFYLSVNLEDYFEYVTTKPAAEAKSIISSQDLQHINVTEQQYQDSTKYFTITKVARTVEVRNKITGERETHTLIQVTITPRIAGLDMKVYNVIPKKTVEDVNGLVLTDRFTVLDPDPMVVWSFADVRASKQIMYHVNDDLSAQEIDEIDVVAVADPIQKRNPLVYFVPAVVILGILLALYTAGTSRTKNVVKSKIKSKKK